jgi:predicted nucleotidyltransferase
MDEAKTEYGDRESALGGEILRSVVGSGVHGIAIAGTDDHDEMGIFVQPPEQVLGLTPPTEHYIFRTQPEGHRSGPGDVDLVVYSLRKYLRLAVQGNPTALLPLYAPPESLVLLTPLGEELRELAPRLLSLQAVRRFLGYMDAQRRLLLPAEDGSAPKGRPELVERHGYDVKYASHALRLAYQGLEVASEGRLTLPMPDEERERVLSVKRGDVTSLEEVVDELQELESRIEHLLTSGASPLPERADLEAVSAWSTRAHRKHWGW